MKKIIIIISVSCLVACAAYKPLIPEQRDADRADQKFPGTTLTELKDGQMIFEANCGKCHSKNRPFKRSEEEIKAALPRMAKRAKIDSKQQELVLKYLLTMKPVKQS